MRIEYFGYSFHDINLFIPKLKKKTMDYFKICVYVSTGGEIFHEIRIFSIIEILVEDRCHIEIKHCLKILKCFI